MEVSPTIKDVSPITQDMSPIQEDSRHILDDWRLKMNLQSGQIQTLQFSHLFFQMKIIIDNQLAREKFMNETKQLFKNSKNKHFTWQTFFFGFVIIFLYRYLYHFR